MQETQNNMVALFLVYQSTAMMAVIIYIPMKRYISCLLLDLQQPLLLFEFLVKSF